MNATISRSNRIQLPTMEAPAGAKRAIMVFNIGSQSYALPLSAVQEVVPMAALSRPPGLPNILAGFLNLGGQAVPVLRLDRLFAAADLTLGLYTPLVILRNAEEPLALMVEQISKIISVSEADVISARESYSFNDCAEGMVSAAEGAIVLLSPERLLLEKERQCLAELEAREQERLKNWEGTGW